MRDALTSYKQDGRREIVLKPGSIYFKGTSIGCMVLNISTGGAGLLLESDAAIPFAFDLEISGEHNHRRCLIVWRNDRQIGVVFDLDERFGSSWLKSDAAEAATATVSSPAPVPALSGET
jgi:hypothetical protein